MGKKKAAKRAVAAQGASNKEKKHATSEASPAKATPPAIHIRRIVPKKDSAPLYAIAKGLSEWFDKDALAVIKEDLSECPGFVAEQEGLPIGFVMYYNPASVPAPGRYELIWIAVKRQCHRFGAGALLLQRLEEEIRSFDPHAELIVWTEAASSGSEHYKKTRAFYYKHGFEDWFVDDSNMAYWQMERLYLRKSLSQGEKGEPASPRQRRKMMYQDAPERKRTPKDKE
jgi:GNAT superfamily N-acetyltransferase